MLLEGAEDVIVWGSKVRTVWRMWQNVPFQFLDGVHGASSHVWTGVILEKCHWWLRSFSLVPHVTFEYWRCCLIIVFTLPSLMFCIPDNSRTVIRLFSWMSTSTQLLVLASYGSPWPALMRFILHRFPSIFKSTTPLIDTNIWQCLLTILALQTWTDFRRFTTFFRQEFDYNALFHANVYLRLAPPSSQLIKLRSSEHQVGELLWNRASTFYILLLSTDLAAFLNYEQIIIHICPRLTF